MKKNKKERKERRKSISTMTRCIFNFNFTEKARPVDNNGADSYVENLLSTIHSKRSFNRSSSISPSLSLVVNIQNVQNGRWTRRRSLETGNGIPVWFSSSFVFHAEGERKLLRNLRIDGDARVSFITLHARPDRDEKLRVLSPTPRNTKWKPAPPGNRVSFAKNTAHTPGWFIFYSWDRATGTVFSSDFSRVAPSPPSFRFASFSQYCDRL